MKGPQEYLVKKDPMLNFYIMLYLSINYEVKYLVIKYIQRHYYAQKIVMLNSVKRQT